MDAPKPGLWPEMGDGFSIVLFPNSHGLVDRGGGGIAAVAQKCLEVAGDSS